MGTLLIPLRCPECSLGGVVPIDKVVEIKPNMKCPCGARVSRTVAVRQYFKVGRGVD